MTKSSEHFLPPSQIPKEHISANIPDFFSLFNYLTPHKCKKIMRTMQNPSLNRQVPDAIEKYSTLFPENLWGKKVPLPLSKDYLDEKINSLSKQNMLFLEDSKELFEMSTKATRAKYTLCYYSWHSFLAFLIYNLLRYDEASKGHGMTVNPMKIDEICINIKARTHQGFLNRLIDLLTVLGYPIALSDWIPIIKEDQSLDFIENHVSTINKKKISFNELDKFDIEKFLSKISTDIGWKYRPSEFPYYAMFYQINKYVLSYIMMFIASNFERYRPHYWSTILDADNEFTSRVLIRTREAYEDYASFVVCADDNIFRRLRLY